MHADRLVKLEALSDRLEAELGEASAATLPALSRELRLVWAELDSVPSKEVNPVDDIGAARAARRAKAQVSDRSTGS